MSKSIEVISQLIQTVHKLRAPGGCPWDRAQTHQTLRQHLLEETYETLDILDQVHESTDLKKDKIRNALVEELGDVLMQVLIHSELASEVEAFNIYDVANALNEKLIRRHPHVFGETKADSPESALKNWERQKAQEKSTQPDAGVLSGIPKGLPALQRTGRVLEKVTRVGFQWKDMKGPLEKIDEEVVELKTEILELEKALQAGNVGTEAIRKKAEAEFGDLIFSLCNVAFLMKINTEDALRHTLIRFENRFKHVEKKLKEQGKTPEQSTLEEMDIFWNDAKKYEKESKQ